MLSPVPDATRYGAFFTDMLSKTDRNIVEMIRRGRNIKIIVDEGSRNQLTLESKSRNGDVVRLAHEVAIAFQSYLNNAKEK